MDLKPGFPADPLAAVPASWLLGFPTSGFPASLQDSKSQNPRTSNPEPIIPYFQHSNWGEAPKFTLYKRF